MFGRAIGVAVHDYSPGVIGIATYFLGRYREFDIAISRIKAPAGSEVRWEMGLNIAYHYNQMIRNMFENDTFQWVWFLGDDHVFQDDLLIKLLDRDVDVVTPLCLRRSMPFQTVIHKSESENYERVGFDFLHGKTGMIDISDKGIGNAGMLVRRKVLEAIPSPWHESGKTDPELGGSDLYFCEKIRKAGFSSYLDLDNRIGHITHAAVWPCRDENNNYYADVMLPHSGM